MRDRGGPCSASRSSGPPASTPAPDAGRDRHRRRGHRAGDLRGPRASRGPRLRRPPGAGREPLGGRASPASRRSSWPSTPRRRSVGSPWRSRNRRWPARRNSSSPSPPTAGGPTGKLLRQEYNFSPPGTTFEREDWAVPAEGVTHLRLVIRPDKGASPAGRRSPRWSCGERLGRSGPASLGHPRGTAGKCVERKSSMGSEVVSYGSFLRPVLLR